ncbi:hypothetical protein [Actinophytocola sp.]|uniref:hypothetical protein n=1 Tax=Actinophytocola sp. TaxID=1872138 RepID=UPI002D7E1D76|nr:hypothetical protein [Actinophytocola sp.]HET9139184.1 hypothetical protein [Actinophytocola sp.]
MVRRRVAAGAAAVLTAVGVGMGVPGSAQAAPVSYTCQSVSPIFYLQETLVIGSGCSGPAGTQERVTISHVSGFPVRSCAWATAVFLSDGSLSVGGHQCH